MSANTEIEKLLRVIYFNPKDTAGFSGLNRLLKRAKQVNKNVTLKDVKSFVSKVDAYTIHRNARKRFSRQAILANHVDEQWQADSRSGSTASSAARARANPGSLHPAGDRA